MGSCLTHPHPHTQALTPHTHETTARRPPADAQPHTTLILQLGGTRGSRGDVSRPTTHPPPVDLGGVEAGHGQDFRTAQARNNRRNVPLSIAIYWHVSDAG